MSDFAPPPPLPKQEDTSFAPPSSVVTEDYAPPPGTTQTTAQPATIDFSTLKPETADNAQKLATISVLSGKALGQSPDVVQAMAKLDPSWLENWKGGVDAMAKQREIDSLSYLQALGDKSPETAAQIKKLQADQAADPKASLLQQVVSGAGEQGHSAIQGAGMWLLGAITWPSRKLAQVTGIQTADSQAENLAKLGGTLGYDLSKERVAAITDQPATGLGESLKEITAGVTGPTYRALVDQNVDPGVAASASFAIGGALTALQLIPAGRLLPGLQRVGEESFKKAVIALAQNGSLLSLAKLWGTRVATIGAEQAAIGMANATTNVLGQEWAKQYSNATAGTSIPPTSFADLTKDILSQAVVQAAVGTAIGGVTAGLEIRPAYEMGTKLGSIVEDMRAARARNVTPEAPKQIPAEPIPPAPLEQARALLEQPAVERSPASIAETKAGLDATANAIAQAPTPETIPQALEAAATSDALAVTQNEAPASPMKVGDAQLTRLLDSAKAKSGEIALPGVAKDWTQAVTVNDGVAQLWYNDSTGSTRMVTEPLQVEQPPAPDIQEHAVQMAETGQATDAQDFALQMKAEELPGTEKPLAFYEAQWETKGNAEQAVEFSKNDAFLSALTKEDLQANLKAIADNPDALVSKALRPLLDKPLTDAGFQSFLAEAAKSPAKWRKAIENAMDPEARQNLQDHIAEGMASKVTKQATTDALLQKHGDVRLGELTTSTDPEQVKAAQVVSKLARAAMKPPSAAIAYDSRVAIQEMQDSVTLESGPRVREIRDRLRAWYTQHPETPPDVTTQAMLNQTLAGDMKVKDLVDLAEKIDAERMKGRALQTIKRTNERMAVEADRAAIINEVMKGKPFERTKDVGSIQEKKARKGTIDRRGEAMTWSPLRLIDRFGEPGKRLYRQVQDARDAEWRGADPRMEPLMKLVSDLGLTPRTFAKIIKAPNGREYTVSDVIAMKWALQDGGARAHLIDGNGISEEDAKTMIAQLPPGASEYADAIAKQEGEGAWERLSKAYVGDTNAPPPPKVINHFPVRVQDRQYDTPGSAIADDMQMRGRTSVNKRFMVSRKVISPKNQTPMRLDGVALAFQSIREQEHYIASWEIAKRLRRVFVDDRDVRDAIRQKYGEDWNTGIKQWIDAFANPDAFKMTEPADRFANYMRHALTGSGIMFNLSPLGYNFTGPLMAMGDAGPRRLMTSFGKWLMDPKGMYDRVTKALPQVKHASMDPVMNAMKNADPSTYKSMMAMVEQLGYKPLELVDMWTRLIVADAVHQHAIDMNPNISEADAWYKALESIQRNQPSGEQQDLPMMYRSKMLSMGLVFSRQLNQIWNMVTADVPNEMRNGKMLQAIGSLFGIAISGFLIAMMGNKRGPKDAKEAVGWAADQFVVSVPFVGNAIEPLLIGKGYVSRGAEIIPGAQQTIADVTALTKAGTTGDRVDHAVRTLIDVSRFFKMPAVAEKRVYDFVKTGDPWGLVGGKH